MLYILKFVLLVFCFSGFIFVFFSKFKFFNKGFLNYDINNINNNVFKEFKMFGGFEMVNCF